MDRQPHLIPSSVVRLNYFTPLILPVLSLPGFDFSSLTYFSSDHLPLFLLSAWERYLVCLSLCCLPNTLCAYTCTYLPPSDPEGLDWL
jgi:hypothetical protein